MNIYDHSSYDLDILYNIIDAVILIRSVFKDNYTFYPF